MSGIHDRAGGPTDGVAAGDGVSEEEDRGQVVDFEEQFQQTLT
jgi:hypothetical protein